MEKQRFVFYDEDSRELSPWELRAGMVITSTDYDPRDNQVVCCVARDESTRPLVDTPVERTRR